MLYYKVGDNMKKIILVVGLLFLVTGCDNEPIKDKLECTFDVESGDYFTNSVMVINFDGARAEDITMDITLSYFDESSISKVKEILITQKTNLENIGYSVSLSTGAGFERLSAYGTYGTLAASETNGTYQMTKESLENAGYICK